MIQPRHRGWGQGVERGHRCTGPPQGSCCGQWEVGPNSRACGRLTRQETLLDRLACSLCGLCPQSAMRMRCLTLPGVGLVHSLAPASTAFVTDSNRPQPLWQPPVSPPTARLTASGATSEVPFPSDAPLPTPHNPTPPPRDEGTAYDRVQAHGSAGSRKTWLASGPMGPFCWKEQ